MSGRTFVVILFFWAALTIVTPVLVRLSASARQQQYQRHHLESHVGERSEEKKAVLELLPRKALVPSRLLHPLSPAPAPAPEPEPSNFVIMHQASGNSAALS